MSTLELECPGCDQLLELDAGFAGGVCRCSSCGTLMTVPMEAGQAAEAVKRRAARPARPDRPDRPTTADEAEQASGERATVGAGGAEGSADPGAEGGDAGASASAGGRQVYTTASGREVHVGAASIPTAKRKQRPMVRMATAFIFASVLLAVLGLAGVAVWVLGTAPEEAGEPAALETFAYDHRLNPYEHPLANVLGLPVAERAVVVVDASEASADWLDEVNAALRAGLLGTRSASEVVLVYVDDEGVHVHPSGPRALVNWREGALASFQAGVSGGGQSWLDEAIARAMQWLPRQVVLVVGREPSERELEAIRRAFEADAAASLDVVAVNVDSAALDDLTAAYRGRYVPLTVERLEAWRGE